MGSLRRVHSRELKLEVARALVTGEKRFSQVCRENNLCESVVRRWKEQYQAKGENAFLEAAATSQTEEAGDKARIASLEASLGRAHLEVEFLKAALQNKGCAPGRKP